ncbi:MAG: alpha-amylase, partial [Bacilli bacterium]|nr:alpha-amylase [Bacilli bacterium]
MTTLEKEAEEESTTVSESEDEGELPLPKDASTGYTFENVSNADGSMSYEIFVRSFYDSDGNGIGDLRGVDSKIPYLADLGIKTIWLMPIHPSPSYHGYDVTDYYAINPDYGTLNDFDSLVATASTYN